MTRKRQAANRAVQAGLDAAVASAATPTVAKAAKPLTRRAAPILVTMMMVMAAGWVLFFTVAGGAAVSIPALVAANAAVAAESTLPGQVCLPDTPTGSLDSVPELSRDQKTRTAQLENAARIIAAGRDAGVPARGWVVAMAAGLVESTLLNLPSQAMPDSLNYPHDTYADGSIPAGDHQSVGLMQDQPWWWNNNMADGMNPAYQARQFYGGDDDTPDIPGLLDIPGWEDMPVWEAAQSVQRSAFPMRYGDVEASATTIVQVLAEVDPGTCQPAPAGDGSWQWPLNPMPGLGSPFGMRRHPILNVVKLHDGADYSATCGTPLLAAGSGTVSVTHPAWSGNLVTIDHGGDVATSYGHMQTVSVRDGQTVTAGDVIGEVGTLGYSTGCHLHFMVIVDGVPVDPVPWLTNQINQNPPPAPDRGTPPRDTPPRTTPPGGLSVLTYNVHYGRVNAATREVTTLAARHQPDVICLQEAAGVRRAPPGYRLHQPRVNTHGGKGPAASPLLIRATIPITAKGHVELTGRKYVGKLGGKGAAYSTPRQIVWATLNSGLTVGCTHFTAAKDANATRGGLWQTQATKSVRFLAGGSGRLLAGDFNASPTSPAMRGFRRAATVDDNRAPTHAAGGRIDMVWGSAGVTPNGGRALPRMGSDHMPVLTEWMPR